ncbi:MAG: hypothetical protein LBJ57_05760 [Prevotellaceae bacterium]|jgi:hypothetical protein|nr:hypothetical protein [Prevotellaceae bacterium]
MAVDMTYNFRWDTEPTDEQLEQLMREVGEEARDRWEKADKEFWQNFHKEMLLAEEWMKSRKNET